jgi:hypothetical protein
VERLTGLASDVVGHYSTGFIDAILATDHNKIMASRDAHCLSERWIDMKLGRIEIADCIHAQDTRTEWRPWT